LRQFLPVLLLGAAAVSPGTAATRVLPAGDADRGLAVFRTRGCAGCHSINGEGGTRAPDLGIGDGRSLSPYALAGAMWSHAPAMWAAMEESGAPRPQLSEQDAADLFVYIFASRYFERPGNPKQGRQVFVQKRCSNCHGVASAIREGIQPAKSWGSLENPIALAQRMWNHSLEMRPALEREKVPYPRLTAQDLTHLLAYVRSVGGDGRPAESPPGPADSGERLYASKGCARCHVGRLKLEARPTRYSFADFAASMWNHPSRAPHALPPLTYGEMRNLLGYILSAQFLEERGNQDRGKVVYGKKRCGACHEAPASGAPSRQVMAGRMTSFEMIAALWKHGPEMLRTMRSKNIPWPRFAGAEMADLATYLRGVELRRRQPADGAAATPRF
jgi:mono/diheme cytochrome c family protein